MKDQIPFMKFVAIFTSWFLFSLGALLRYASCLLNLTIHFMKQNFSPLIKTTDFQSLVVYAI